MKPWLVGMSGPGSLENLRELIDPIKHAFRGVVWVLHDARDSEEAHYLETVKGEGKVIHYYYCNRHCESRNQYLWCGPIKQGDWCVQVDHLERLAEGFLKEMPRLIQQLDSTGYNATYFFGKVFMFKYHESMRYQGTPHEGFHREDGGLRGVELNQIFTQETDARYSVRHLKRDEPYSWLRHYLSYYLRQPWGSNHVLLGNCDRPERGTEKEIYLQREHVRLEMLEYLRSKGVELTVDGFYEYLTANPKDPVMLRLCSLEKITNDAYRFRILNDFSVTDHHHWKDLKDLTK